MKLFFKVIKAKSFLIKSERKLHEVQDKPDCGCMSCCPSIVTRSWTRLVTRPLAAWRVGAAAKKYDKARGKLADYVAKSQVQL